MAIQRPFSKLEWQLTPESVRRYTLYLEQALAEMQKQLGDQNKRLEKIEVRLGKNSANSSKPPSSDSPYKKKRKKGKSARKRGGQKGHKGHQREMLPPTSEIDIFPDRCTCGNRCFAGEFELFYTHQQIELPEILLEVTDHRLYMDRCLACGRTVKAKLPRKAIAGYGPRLTAFLGELSGIEGMSRSAVMHLCGSVLKLRISTGGIQKIVDRVAAALEPFHERCGQIARRSDVNYIDETSWRRNHDLHWLWAMVNPRVAYYRIDPNRSKEAFDRLIEDWRGILVSDSYSLYRNWVHGRQTCLAHLIRKADGLSERKNRDLQCFGKMMAGWLRQLVGFAHGPPDEKQWETFYRHLLFTLSLYEPDKTDAGRLARQIVKELDALHTFLQCDGVEPTNNRAERALRFGVLWRKRSLGTQSVKGNRWVERILTLKETCRLNGRHTFPTMVELIRRSFHGKDPDLSWV